MINLRTLQYGIIVSITAVLIILGSLIQCIVEGSIRPDGISATQSATLPGQPDQEGHTSPTSSPVSVSQSEQNGCQIPTDWYTYEVQSGDTLDALSIQAGLTGPEILTANCLTSATLQTGQHIGLPPELSTNLITPSP